MRSCYLTVLSTLIFQLAFSQTDSAIHGIWQNSEFGYQMTLILNPDGSGEFDGEEIRFTKSANTLRLVSGGIPTIYNYTLNKNTLSLSGGDLDGTIVFNKGGAAATQIDQVATNDQVTDTRTNTNNTLIGIWGGSGETIEFKSNGECAYLGNVFRYQSTADRITLTTNQGDVAFGYSISGEQLTLSGSGGNAVYKKGTSGSQPAGTSTKGVAMELVGKWCWINVTSTNSGGTQSSRCIILNADGTYLYQAERSASVNTDAFYGGTNSQSSDQGTWYVQGDRIFYNSQSTGQGSYRLEKRNHPKNVNDPMIVLDGEAYVTATLRQPWR